MTAQALQELKTEAALALQSANELFDTLIARLRANDPKVDIRDTAQAFNDLSDILNTVLHDLAKKTANLGAEKDIRPTLEEIAVIMLKAASGGYQVAVAASRVVERLIERQTNN